MAIYGVGAHHDGVDVTQEFISNECACTNWSATQAPALYVFMNSLKIGDIIYIKSYPPNIGLIVKAIGLVRDNMARSYPNLGFGVPIKWLWQGNQVVNFSDKYNVHQNTLYEEFVPEVQDFIFSTFN